MTIGKAKIRKLIKQNIKALDPEAEVILYGSRARGEERFDSDWDILVLTDYPIDTDTEEKFRNQLYEIEIETGEPISIFVFSRNEWQTEQRITPFYDHVNRKGIIL